MLLSMHDRDMLNGLISTLNMLDILDNQLWLAFWDAIYSSNHFAYLSTKTTLSEISRPER